MIDRLHLKIAFSIVLLAGLVANQSSSKLLHSQVAITYLPAMNLASSPARVG